MAKCEICEKTAIHGNKLSITRSHISKRAPRTWKPNLRTVKAEVDGEIKRIAQIHGCQVIVNGVYSSLKYYLRLVKDPAEFIDHYVELLKVDETVKFPHKKAWNDIISEGI